MSVENQSRPTAALFVTCLVDLMRPSVGFAAAKLIEHAGFEVIVPDGQTCCGQPNYNSGDRNNAKKMAARTISVLEDYEQVVVPSGSCAAMIVVHYPALFEDDPDMLQCAESLAERTRELTVFLSEEGLDSGGVAVRGDGKVAYHDFCSGLRELGIKQQPRALLTDLAVHQVQELEEPDVCCGFGGTFCVKYPDISGRMVENKVADIAATGAETVAMGDVGCLLNIEGRMLREGRPIKVQHVAEVLAARLDDA